MSLLGHTWASAKYFYKIENNVDTISRLLGEPIIMYKNVASLDYTLELVDRGWKLSFPIYLEGPDHFLKELKKIKEQIELYDNGNICL